MNIFKQGQQEDAEDYEVSDPWCDSNGDPIARGPVLENLPCIYMFDGVLLRYWTIWYGFGVCLMELIGAALFSLMINSAAYWWGGPSSFNVVMRALLTSAALFFIKISVGRFSGAYLDPWRSLAAGLTWVLTRGKNVRKGWVWLELVKVPIFVIMQFVGWNVGMALSGVTSGLSVKTGDCVTDPSIACFIYPSAVANETTASWQEGMGQLIIYGAIVFSERYLECGSSKKQSNEKMTIRKFWAAVLYSCSYAFVYMAWGLSSGGSFFFWFYVMSSWYSNLNNGAEKYIWPGIVGIFVVMVFDVVAYYVRKRFISGRKASMD